MVSRRQRIIKLLWIKCNFSSTKKLFVTVKFEKNAMQFFTVFSVMELLSRSFSFFFVIFAYGYLITKHLLENFCGKSVKLLMLLSVNCNMNRQQKLQLHETVSKYRNSLFFFLFSSTISLMANENDSIIKVFPTDVRNDIIKKKLYKKLYLLDDRENGIFGMRNSFHLFSRRRFTIWNDRIV